MSRRTASGKSGTYDTHTSGSSCISATVTTMIDAVKTRVKAELCPGAAKREALAFLGRYCLAEAKPLAEKHCAGRDFTALRAGKGTRDKYDDFCMAYLSSASLAQAPRPDAPSTPTANPADAVTDGVTQGINKLRGLFGR